MDHHEHAALEQRYQQLFEQTSRIEQAARRSQQQPFQIDPRYSSLCRELEAVTLQLARGHAPATRAMEPIR